MQSLHPLPRVVLHLWLLIVVAVPLLLLQKAVVTSPIGGEFLTECLMKSLESKGIVVC
ncbi:hypothetical protein ZOSMA_229G00090 [Zostera marina]|uniref:Uncharacterized protein n=1 Tax=Zostera marina TaxID=29655 RepID=A0A0K9PIR7_ZOSMR|nr:hypothetical protein ZOSMA_229G00090 [Zostera marina]